MGKTGHSYRHWPTSNNLIHDIARLFNDNDGIVIFFADEAEEEEPEEVRQAWEELILIQKEQDRYAGIKLDLEQDLKEVRKTAVRLEDVSV